MLKGRRDDLRSETQIVLLLLLLFFYLHLCVWYIYEVLQKCEIMVNGRYGRP